MAAKNVLKDFNKSHTLAALNLQQMRLLFKIIFKKLHNTLLSLPLEKQSNFITRISRITEKNFIVQVLLSHICFI